MIFSREHKYIFIRVPKTGTLSVCDKLMEIDPSALRNAVELSDGRRIAVDPHVTARELRAILGDEFNKYSVVAFVRDPVSLITSKYYFYRQGRASLKAQKGQAKRATRLKVWVARFLPLPIWAILYPFKESAYFICGENGDILATKIGLFERLPDDFTRIFSEVGLDGKDLNLKEKKNVTTYDRNVSENNRLLEIIAKIKCRHDYKIISKLAI